VDELNGNSVNASRWLFRSANPTYPPLAPLLPPPHFTIHPCPPHCSSQYPTFHVYS
jgi:hypothetical protein